MTGLEIMLSQPVVERLGWMLIHFVWQGAAVALVLAIVLALLRRSSAKSRYVVALAALLAMVLLPVQTFIMLPARGTSPPSAPMNEGAMLASAYPVDSNRDWRSEVSSPPFPYVPNTENTRPGGSDNTTRPIYMNVKTEEPSAGESIGLLAIPPHRSGPSAAPAKEPASPRLEAFLPWIVCAWLVGVLVLSLRLLGGWLQAHRLKRRLAEPLGDRWQETLSRLMRQMRVSPPVRLVESAVAQVPIAIGWLRPVILLPASALTGLTPRQLEAILAHELAHILRHDYLLNLFQTVIETLLFYHPAVWWVSRRIRIERENCCDDIAVAVCGDAVTYARALTELEQCRDAPALPAVAADGGLLLHRIRRLVGIRTHCASRSGRWLAGLLAIATVLVFLSAIYVSGRALTQAGKADAAAAASPESDRPVGLPVWDAHVAESEKRIAYAAEKKSFEEAARFSERLLGDYARGKGFLLQRWQRLKSATATFPKWGVCGQLAHFTAHLGDFEQAQTWIDRAKAILPSRNHERYEQEIALCRIWVPRREAAKKGYTEKPSLENARVLLRAYAQLDEYASMKRLTEEMEIRFSKNPWLASEELQSIRNFVTGYVTFPQPPSKRTGSPTVPARNPQIEGTFEKLEANWQKRLDFAWAKWSRMSAIEKAKYINDHAAQRTLKGAWWEPTQEEAEAFLRERNVTSQPGPDERKRLRGSGVRDGVRLTKEEALPFDNEESSLTAALAAMGEAAIPDLLAKIQQVFWGTRAGREAVWAQKSLGRMSGAAIPPLSREVEKILQTDPTGRRQWTKMRYLVQALAVDRSPEAIPALRRALEFPDRAVRESAIDGLRNIPGGLTQDMLIRLWEDSDAYIRRIAAQLLGDRGDREAIKVLERDIPTAYADARYQAEYAVWQIKKRLGQDAGEPPERVRYTKMDPAPLYEGIEKSLQSPNKGIRATAREHLEMNVWTPRDLEPLIRAMEDDSDEARRLQASRSLATALYQSVRKTTAPLQFAPAFDALAKAIADGDEKTALAALGAADFFGTFKDRPGFDGVVKRVFDGVDSPSTAFRAECLHAFARLLYDDPERMRRYLTPAGRQSIARAIMAGFPADYGRYLADAMQIARLVGITEATPGLIEIATTHPEAHIRLDAARTLGEIGDARAIAALERMASSDPFVDSQGFHSNREIAWQALKTIREKSGAGSSAGREAGDSPAYVEQAEKIIAQAADRKDYEKAARLCEHLLGDFERSGEYLLQRWERLEKTKATFVKWGVCRKLALCNAHAGDFDAAQSWLDRMRELIPSRSLWPWEKELALCKTWVPRREAAGKSYAQDSSLKNARDLLNVYEQLDEFAAMRRLVEEMENRFGADPWLKSEEFQSIAGFAKAYAVLPKPQTKPKEPQVIPAKDPRIDPVFDRLEANRNRQLDLAWAKWSRMSAIEKAKYINSHMAQQPAQGLRWEPTLEEAKAYLRAHKITDQPGPEEREGLRKLGVYDGASLTKEEKRPFDQERASLTAELAAMGEDAIPDLLAKMQPGFWRQPTRASLEAGWAQMALGRMGNVAVPVLEREIEKVFSGQSGGGRPGVLMKHFVNALVSIGTAEAIPALRRSLDFSDRSVQYAAIQGLRKIPGGLTQELLLELWETCNDYNRRSVANLLGERGDRKALAILERDVPTAYANARYQAEYAIWRIKSRLGMEAGERPEPIRSTKKGDTALLWEGVEKSVDSPNKAIRASAFKRLETTARTPQALEPLVRAMKTDPDRATRALAARSLATAFYQSVRETTAPLQFAEAFDALADAIANGDEAVAIAGLGASVVVGRFRDRPGYDGIVRRTLSFLDSPSTSVRAQCMDSLERMLSNDPEGIHRRITPGARKSIVDAVKAGLATDYGRYTVDAIRVAKAAGITEAIPNLIEIAGSHPDHFRRRDAAGTLGAIGDARAIPALQRMARSDPFVNYEGIHENREAAWQALKAIRERESRQGT